MAYSPLVTDGSRKVIFAAFFANLGIAISKFVGFLITGSASLVAETIHSAADTGNQLLLFFGGRRAGRAATPEHPFYEGIQKFLDPHEVARLGVAVGILVVAIVGAIESTTYVDRLIHLRTEHIGPDEILVGAKVEYSSALTTDELVAAINATEDSIRATFPVATVIYLEPDVHRTDHPDLVAQSDAPDAH